MIDTHSHIYGEEFAEDRDEVVLRAQQAGVRQIFLPNINAESIAPMLELCRRWPDYCFPMMGLHPTDLTPDYSQTLDYMCRLLQEPANPYIAVGEVGLDFYWDDSMRTEQLDAFDRQVQWARDLRLPLMIHSRSAHKELVDVLSRYKSDGLTGVFHCFGGTADEARELLAFEGFALGIGGVLTYKKSALPATLQACVPLSRIVLETDSPYLAPVPHRGKRNESAYVLDVAKKVAEVYGVSLKDVQKETTRTVRRIFCDQKRTITR